MRSIRTLRQPSWLKTPAPALNSTVVKERPARRESGPPVAGQPHLSSCVVLIWSGGCVTSTAMSSCLTQSSFGPASNCLTKISGSCHRGPQAPSHRTPKKSLFSGERVLASMRAKSRVVQSVIIRRHAGSVASADISEAFQWEGQAASTMPPTARHTSQISLSSSTLAAAVGRSQRGRIGLTRTLTGSSKDSGRTLP